MIVLTAITTATTTMTITITIITAILTTAITCRIMIMMMMIIIITTIGVSRVFRATTFCTVAPVFVGPMYGTFFMLHFWRQEF
jgi:hypothetical protein